MTMLKEQAKPGILNLEVPYSFASRQDAAQTVIGLNQETLAISKLQIEKLNKIREVLAHPELAHLIDEGKITLGIIKPLAFDGRDLPEDDESAAKQLLSEINGKVVFEFPTQLTREQAEEFYLPNKERFLQIPFNGSTVWESNINFLTSGPLTFILICDETGDAVTWWRDKMGPTRGAGQTAPDSIRGRHAIDEKLPNNLVHGSDSQESVKTEVAILSDIVASAIDQAEKSAQKFPTETLLTQLSLITEGETLKSMTMTNGSVQLEVIDETGQISTRSYRTENN